MLKLNKIKIDQFVQTFQKLAKKIAEKISARFCCEKDIDYKPQREYVSELIFKALTDAICVREALLKFPADSIDPSVQTAWHALCHLEADEDIRRRDPDYANEQNDYLEMIAFTLQKGEELPKNIINSYKKYHKEALIPHAKGAKGVIAKLTRFLNF